MKSPFPGMDPYLEHAALWEGFHSRLVVTIANLLQPLLDPRYIASVEERVFIEGPQQRIPDVWIQASRTPDTVGLRASSAVLETAETDPAKVDKAIVVEIEDLEIRQKSIEILDSYNQLKVVTVIEALSPTNKRRGPGFESYERKQQELLSRDCHLVEIDLLRTGSRILAVPEWKLNQFQPFDYLACISRWENRNRYEIYPRRIEERLPSIAVPLAEGDPDAALNLQDAFDQVYADGRYMKRLRYNLPCEPPLGEERQCWANEQIQKAGTIKLADDRG